MKICAVFLTSYIAMVMGDTFGYFTNFEKAWEKSAPACAGKNQSPIHIKTQSAVELSIPALELDGYQNLLPAPISLSNNGHSVELRPIKGPVSDNTPQIFGGVLLNRYHLDSFHFHWGSKNSQGSEHVIDNVRYPMELHIIHRNEKYPNISEAIRYRDGLAVLAFFLETRERANPALEPILNELPSVLEENSSVNMSITFPLFSLLPGATDIFYAYKGSLTTPPCSEVVTWIVFPDPVTLSFDQIDKFRTLTSNETNNGQHHLEDNFRHLEPLNGRKIYVKRQPAFASSFKNLNFTAPNMTDLKYLG